MTSRNHKGVQPSCGQRRTMLNCRGLPHHQNHGSFGIFRVNMAVYREDHENTDPRGSAQIFSQLRSSVSLQNSMISI